MKANIMHNPALSVFLKMRTVPGRLLSLKVGHFSVYVS